VIIRPHNDELDAALAMAQPGHVIVLPMGVSTTRGNWTASKERAWRNVPAGVRIVGEHGSERHIIRLSPDAERRPDGVLRPDRDLDVLWAGPGVTLQGVTLDSNEGAFRASGSEPPWYVGGLRTHGRINLEDVRWMCLRGDWKPEGTLSKEIERFALSGPGPVTGSRIHNCHVHAVAESAYVSGIFAGGPCGELMATVSDCTVDLGWDNQFGFSANRNVLFSRVRCRGGRYGFYNDTGPTIGIQIRDLFATASWAGISVISQRPEDFRLGIRVSGGHIAAPRLVEVVQKPGGAAPVDVVVSGVEFGGEFVSAIDNDDPCTVRIQDCILSRDAVRFRTRRSPEAITRANFRPDGTGHPNQLKQLVS
jgi:hypothetical protein